MDNRQTNVWLTFNNLSITRRDMSQTEPGSSSAADVLPYDIQSKVSLVVQYTSEYIMYMHLELHDETVTVMNVSTFFLRAPGNHAASHGSRGGLVKEHTMIVDRHRMDRILTAVRGYISGLLRERLHLPSTQYNITNAVMHKRVHNVHILNDNWGSFYNCVPFDLNVSLNPPHLTVKLETSNSEYTAAVSAARIRRQVIFGPTHALVSVNIRIVKESNIINFKFDHPYETIPPSISFKIYCC